MWNATSVLWKNPKKRRIEKDGNVLDFLSVRDVVLIDKLDLEFGDGLNVLTGETGAGKSVLLDSLSLALGGRGEASLVRRGADRLSVSASFSLPENHKVFEALQERGIDSDGQNVVLRRIVNKDGKSKAFINDTPVGVGVLKVIGDGILEIHGQFANFALLNPAAHLGVLDAFGGLQGKARETADAYNAYKSAQNALLEAQNSLRRAQEEEDFVRHAANELERFGAYAGEEEELAEKRTMMMNAEKLIDALKSAADSLNAMDADKNMRAASRAVDRLNAMTNGKYQAIADSLDAAGQSLNDAVFALQEAGNDVDLDGNLLESVEDRLFEMRSLARKYQTTCDGLPDKLAEFQAALNALDKGTASLAALEKDVAQTRAAYENQARELSALRRQKAALLDEAVKNELEPLKLGKAVFVTKIDDLPESERGASGTDKVVFCAATNAGQAAGALNKIASGGELSRFMLALKVVLRESEKTPTMVFDEVDAGVGGATAFAVGERLAKLSASGVQILVVTHSPQVAASGKRHFVVSKSEKDGVVTTAVRALSDAERTEEIARMLSGERITDASRAAAVELLKGQTS